MFNVQPVPDFNVSSVQDSPGFRVGQPKDVPGFRVRPFIPGFRLNTAGQSVDGNPASTVGVSAYGITPYIPGLSDMDMPAPATPVVTDDYCRQVIANCRTQCATRYEALGGNLGFPWMRKCIRDCVAPSGCSY